MSTAAPRGRLPSVASKLALFSAGVFVHGGADHAMVAMTGHAPDVNAYAATAAMRWALAAFNFAIAVALYVGHRRLESQRAGPPAAGE